MKIRHNIFSEGQEKLTFHDDCTFGFDLEYEVPGACSCEDSLCSQRCPHFSSERCDSRSKQVVRTSSEVQQYLCVQTLGTLQHVITNTQGSLLFGTIRGFHTLYLYPTKGHSFNLDFATKQILLMKKSPVHTKSR